MFYCSFLFFCNFGPNTTTFVIPTESFPTAIRSTCHGVSAAAGKIGAAVGVAIFIPIINTFGSGNIFLSVMIIWRGEIQKGAQASGYTF